MMLQVQNSMKTIFKPVWNDKLILIAEDEESNYLYLKELLRNTQAKVIHVYDGRQAVEVCRKEPIDLVLMDIKMPEMNGFQAASQIKNFNEKIIIIAQTAYAMTEDRDKALQAGCDNYIAKPIHKDDLLYMMSAYL